VPTHCAVELTGCNEKNGMPSIFSKSHPWEIMKSSILRFNGKYSDRVELGPLPKRFGFIYRLFIALFFLAGSTDLLAVVFDEVSGGDGTTIKTYSLLAPSGFISVSYDMYSVPDRLQIILDGVTLLDTGYVSGTGNPTVFYSSFVGSTLSIRIDGGNSTAWRYKLTLPDAPVRYKSSLRLVDATMWLLEPQQSFTPKFAYYDQFGSLYSYPGSLQFTLSNNAIGSFAGGTFTPNFPATVTSATFTASDGSFTSDA